MDLKEEEFFQNELIPSIDFDLYTSIYEKRIELKTAKLAKEKDFNAPVMAFYFQNFNAGLDYILVDYIGDGQFGEFLTPKNYNEDNWEIKHYSAPTQTELQNWLRNKFKIHVEPFSTYFKTNFTYGYKINTKDGLDQIHGFKTWNEALEKGLYFGLELIKYDR